MLKRKTFSTPALSDAHAWGHSVWISRWTLPGQRL